MFDWRSYYELATELVPPTVQTQLDRAKCRTSISRAYYAALSTARGCIVEQDPTVSDNQLRNHGFICNYFANRDSSVENNITLTSNLQKLMRHRRLSDYSDACIPRLEALVRRALRLSEQVLDLLELL